MSREMLPWHEKPETYVSCVFSHIDYTFARRCLQRSGETSKVSTTQWPVEHLNKTVTPATNLFILLRCTTSDPFTTMGPKKWALKVLNGKFA